MKELWTKKTTSVPTKAPDSTATNSKPPVDVETQTLIKKTDALVSPKSPVHRNRQQGNALYRDRLEQSTGGGGGDDGLSPMIRVHTNGSEPASEGSVW